MTGTQSGRTRRRLSSLPLRVRLVTGFTAAMTAVLAVAGSFVYWRVTYALDLRLNNDLRAVAVSLAPAVSRAGLIPESPVVRRTPGGHLYQVLDSGGRVLDAGDQLGRTPLLPPARIGAAMHGETFTDVGALLPVSRRPLRLLAVPLRSAGPARVLLVAERRDGRDEALRELLAQLVVAGLGALVVTAVVGERLAKAALAPVERYRAQADRIAGGATGVRLDVPPGRDDEVTRLGRTLNEVLSALELAVEHERRFTQDAAHELRTPLTLLSTRVQLALTRQRTAADHEATLRELGHDITDLRTLTEQLLTISTLETAHPPAEPGCDLAAVISTTVRELAVTGERGPFLRHAGDSGDDLDQALVRMPAAQVRQVIANLVTNAATHGHPPCAVRLQARDRVAVLVVSDEGPAMDPAFLGVAADRFARADTARGRPGAGLGLALVKTIVERYDGELRLCSAGTHHRYTHRFDVDCEHPTIGTSASMLLPLDDRRLHQRGL